MTETIKIIKKIKRNQYELQCESGRKVIVSEDSLVKHRLLKGSELTEEQLNRLEEEALLDIGYQLALNYLNFQLRSEQELRRYLKKKEIPFNHVTPIIERLRALDLVNDRFFAESYVRTVMRTSDKGPQVIRQQLAKKGVQAADIDAALLLYDEETQRHAALTAAEKALKKYRGKSHQEKQEKTRQLLYQRGFSGDVIAQAMAELAVAKDEEHEQTLLEKEGGKLWRRNSRFEPAKRKQKVMQSLFQKGFEYDLIQQFINQKEMEDDGEQDDRMD